MKKLLVLAAMVTLAAPVAFAGKSSGCGLGQMLFTGQSGLVMNVLAATTNGSFGSQTFGMTTGTSGCDGNDTVYNNQKYQEEFVATNYEVLSEEMAQGHGQYVSALAELMGCDAAAQADFARMTQAQYESLFTAEQAPAALLGNVKAEISKDAVLASNCRVS